MRKGHSIRKVPYGVPVTIEISGRMESQWHSSLKMNTVLKSKVNEVKLSQPIIIIPGRFYKIRVGNFPAGHLFFSNTMKRKQTFGENVKINLHNMPVNDASQKPIGLISSMDFMEM